MLLDTNVLVAAAVPLHPHHLPSNTLIGDFDPLCVAGHSLAEFTSTMTRSGLFEWSGAAADLQLHKFTGFMRVLTLAPQTLVAITRRFALQGGKGPLIYDWLIGQHAVAHDIDTIVTWNIRHMRPLFPNLRVVTPIEFLESV